MAHIDKWLQQLLDKEGSDLHLRSGLKPMMRVHGVMNELEDEPVLTQEMMGSILSEAAGEKRWERFKEKRDLDFAYSLGEKARFRVNYLQQIDGHGAVLRLIPFNVLSLKKLGAPETLWNLPRYRAGLVLVTGPTGSGKSTTLAAIIDEINQTQERHVVTIEDPIEFVHQSQRSVITQREVGADTPSFSRALGDALREDPDVVLVGEMRDLETIALAITLAETGVLVFATLHTNSAAKTVDRLIDVFPAKQQQQVRTMLSESLSCIVAQQLLRRADKPGRIAAHEILFSSKALASVIREGKTEKINDLILQGRNRGMIDMDTTLNDLLQSGKINGEEAYMKSLDKQRFAEYFEEISDDQLDSQRQREKEETQAMESLME